MSAWPSVSPSRWDTVVMFRCPDVLCRSAPSMSTTSLPLTSPSVSNVGPGPRATYGTVTADSSSPKIRIGAIATIRVNIRLFTPPTVKGNERGGPRRPPWFTLSVTRAGT